RAHQWPVQLGREKAEAPRRISLARRSSFTSARSRLISADSSLLGYVIVAHGRSGGWHGWVTGGWGGCIAGVVLRGARRSVLVLRWPAAYSGWCSRPPQGGTGPPLPSRANASNRLRDSRSTISWTIAATCSMFVSVLPAKASCIRPRTSDGLTSAGSGSER